MRGSLLCAPCEIRLPWLPAAICPGCGSAGPHATPRPRCAGATGPLGELLAACAFEGPVRRAVHALKYRGARDHAPLLADLLARAVALKLGGIDVLVPVPLATGRRRTRGFNQSELIACGVGERLGIPVATDLVLRTRETDAQVGLGVAERRANVEGAFRCSRGARIAGRHLALLDDVTTTGATLRACAEPLMAAGAASVIGLAVAKEL
ncbi:MAG: ComF family protein [Chloroflexota bacterium]|nr:ComF family protein [Chloroflexota bacterium]